MMLDAWSGPLPIARIGAALRDNHREGRGFQSNALGYLEGVAR